MPNAKVLESFDVFEKARIQEAIRRGLVDRTGEADPRVLFELFLQVCSNLSFFSFFFFFFGYVCRSGLLACFFLSAFSSPLLFPFWKRWPRMKLEHLLHEVGLWIRNGFPVFIKEHPDLDLVGMMLEVLSQKQKYDAYMIMRELFAIALSITVSTSIVES
jgi:hypothetical protein